MRYVRNETAPSGTLIANQDGHWTAVAPNQTEVLTTDPYLAAALLETGWFDEESDGNPLEDMPQDGQSASIPRVVEVADLGDSYALDVEEDTDVWLIATVTEDAAVALDNLPTTACRVKLLLTAIDGPWTVTLDDGTSTTEVEIAEDAVAEINLSWYGANSWVNTEGPGVVSADVDQIVVLTQAAYDGLGTPDDTTLYVVIG